MSLSCVPHVHGTRRPGERTTAGMKHGNTYQVPSVWSKSFENIFPGASDCFKSHVTRSKIKQRMQRQFTK